MKTETSECLLVNKGLNHAEKEQGMSMAYRDRVRPGPPTVNVTTQCVLWSSPVLAMLFGFSTLGTVCCSSGKSVKLTRLWEFGQIMQPVSSLEISFLKRELLFLATKLNNNLVSSCSRYVSFLKQIAKSSKLNRCVIISGYDLTDYLVFFIKYM